MSQRQPSSYIAFEGSKRIAVGDPEEVVLRTKEVIERGELAPVLIFDGETSHPIEIDFRGTPWQVLDRVADLHPAPQVVDPPVGPDSAASRGRGRPRLGVVAREVTLLPRHWEWLSSQTGGASVALRKLVDEARRALAGQDRKRQAQESAYRFMNALAGDLPGFEEATRALFAGNWSRFEEQVQDWPADVRNHATKLARPAFEDSAEAEENSVSRKTRA